MGGMAPARALGQVPFTEHSFYLSAFHRASGNKAIEIIFEIRTKVIGIRSEQFRGMIEGMTHGPRSSTLKDLANAAVFAASDLSRGTTGAVINPTGGIIWD